MSVEGNPKTNGIPDIVIDKDESEVCHFVFCQMDALRPFHDESVWKEVRRWVKFEEELEEDGKRWSKPHVSSLSMQYLTELHLIVTANPVLLDLEATSMHEIVDLLLEHWSSDGTLQPLLLNHVRTVLLKKHKHKTLHKHLHNILPKSLPKIKSGIQLSENHSQSEDEDRDIPNESKSHTNQAYNLSSESTETLDSTENGTSDHRNEVALSDGERNSKFKKKIPPGSEVMNIMVGEVEGLMGNLCAFVRLQTASDIGMITEVDLPTRFLFILLVPKGNLEPAEEAARCMGTLITDDIFREVAYKAESEIDLLTGIQEFTSQTTVLPPGCWNPSTRIEPPDTLPTKETRKAGQSFKKKEPQTHIDATLQRTGRLFGGLVADVKRKLPWYKSDFTDGLHIQCFASFIYLFLATLAPNVTFGGLLGDKIDNFMGPMECILAAAITGVVFALFSGQPMNILGSTGPMLVLEMILYRFCVDRDWDYMPFRCWVGIWIAFIIFIIVALDLSALVRFITRFTEECFACLIALIFIFQAFENLIKIEDKFPIHFHASSTNSCVCENFTIPFNRSNNFNVSEYTTNISNNSAYERDFNISVHDAGTIKNSVLPAYCSEYGGNLTGSGCSEKMYEPNVFFMSCLLFLGTFGIAIFLVNIKGGTFATATVRRTISDFGVLLSIISMVVVDALVGVPTQKLSVPAEFKPSNAARGWFINPWSDKNPWWLILVAAIPALLTTILIFMDQQITAVIVNRPAHKLRKGGGYHLDMLILGILIVVLSLFGLPWYVAATVSALAHIKSLTRESECAAPGEKPTFLGVREQRVTALLVGILSGFAVLITSVLKFIPMPVLYGVFLYMGVASLKGMQLVQRIKIIFIPPKYQPDYEYLRHVPLTKVHLFTFIQIICLGVLWAVKSIHEISIIFPVMVLATCFVRKAMDYFFSENELKWLDGSPPKKKEIEKEKNIDNKRRRESVSARRERCKSLPASTNMGFRPHLPSVDETAMNTHNLHAFDKRQRKISLMTLPDEKTYRKSSERSINSDFQLSVSCLNRSLSQDNTDGIRNQEIFDKRKTRRPSLLAIPPPTLHE
ncbi:electrogenic sodium bicarbonate cotransporter 1-like [Mytilus edulis]|uniref:electrogenic sodium bicarbonate cotransporter 1-like n=1 Tax=Mytilus edulis TaxID=6550 RepID=UPI0039EEF9B2